MTAIKESLNLTTIPDTVYWPETHYVFVEKIGPLQINARQAWEELHTLIPAISEHNQITGYFSLYKVGPQIYRAGVSIAAEPDSLPNSLAYERFHGGKYGRFVLTGSYANLPEACGRVSEIVGSSKIPLRDDYNIENYVNDPRITPEEQLITEIMFPIA